MSARADFLKALSVVGLVVATAAAGAAPATVSLKSGDWLAPRPAVPPFRLIDDGGHPFTRTQLTGRWSLLFFGYTHCSSLCPATLATLAGFERREAGRGRSGPRVVFVSADPARDSPTEVRAFVRQFSPDFVGLTADDPATIDAFARSLDTAVIVHREQAGNYAVDHTGAIFVVDPRGSLAAVLTGKLTAATLQQDFDRIQAARP